MMPTLSTALESSFKQGKRLIRFLFVLFIQPKLELEDAASQEFILNVLLSGSILLCILSDLNNLILSVVQKGDYQGLPIPVLLITTLLFSGLLFLSRKGYVKTASFSLISVYFLITTYGVYHWGPDLQPLVVAYLFIIFISGILINTLVAFSTTIVVSATIIFLAWLQLDHLIFPHLYWKDAPIAIRDMVQLSIMFLLVTIISWLSNREIRRALRRAQRSEKALREKNDSLEQIVEERTRELHRAQAEKVSHLYRLAEFGKLSSGIFHDLMNPLSIVASNINQIEGGTHPDIPEIKDHLGRAVDASKKMERFIGTVKKQIQNSEFEERFLINKEIKDAISLLTYKAMKAGVTIKFRPHREICTFGSPIQFQHVITNLVSNAIDSYEDIQREAEERCVVITLKKRNSNVEIKVSDRGCGIASDVISRIFDPFFTTKSNHRGMGIGLSNSKEIIGKHFNGEIVVHSRQNEGSQFIITFPIKKTCQT